MGAAVGLISLSGSCLDMGMVCGEGGSKWEQLCILGRADISCQLGKIDINHS